MPLLVDTTIRLLSQEPLADRMPTARLLRLAELLDGAGFAYLEVSGGGVFDTAVRRGVESPWERIRALDARTTTPLAMALRGRLLVGSRPVGGDFVRRFVASAAESGIDVFRLHDPLNDVSNLREAGEAIAAAGSEFDAGLIFSPGPVGETETLVERAKLLSELGAARVLLHDPSGALEPHRVQELVGAIGEASGLPVGLYCQGAAGNALAAALEAARAGADRIACAVYPIALTLHRVSAEGLAEALAGLGLEPGITVDALWEASELVMEHIGEEPVTPVAPRVAVRAARHRLPAGLVAALDTHLRAGAAGDRIDEVIEELQRIRSETGWPPLASPIGQVLASQALLHVLSAERYGTVVDEFRELVSGRFGVPPADIAPAVIRAVALLADGAGSPEPPLDFESLRAEAGGLAASEEELILLALFPDDAPALLEAIRGRAGGDDGLVRGSVDQSRAERIREIVRVVQESGVSEITLEEGDLRVTVRRTSDRPADVPLTAVPAAETAAPPPAESAAAAAGNGFVRVESPMVGVFYRASEPGAAPFVEEGDVVEPGQTLCILEAMKLMNHVKADVGGIVRGIAVGNGEPVEFGQLLFELEPLAGQPLDAL